VQNRQGDDCGQHEQATKLREYEKLDCCVDFSSVSPNADQEVHGHEHQFPKQVEQEQVERQEHACDASQDPKEIEMKEADALLNFRPGREDRHQSQEEGQQQ
jgi:hypothetical protein